MYTAIENYLMQLTLRNWGFPWHILLSYLGGNSAEWAILYFSLQIAVWIVALTLFLIGVAYEICQAYRKEVTAKEMIEDLVGNCLGIAFFILL